MTAPLKRARPAIATVALCIRWGSYFAVLTDHDLPQWTAAFDPEVSCIGDGEIARINIEASAALSDWIDLMRADQPRFRKLANGILDAYRKDDIIKKFITNSASPEIDVDVKKVALEEMQVPPFRARVDFYMVYYSPADHSELKRDLYTANFVFVFRTQVPNELIPINPLGLSVTYFREDEAFK